MDNLRQKKRSFGSDAKNHKVIWNHTDAVERNVSVTDASTRLLVHEALYSLYEGVTCNDVAATGQWDCMPILCPQGVRRSSHLLTTVAGPFPGTFASGLAAETASWRALEHA